MSRRKRRGVLEAEIDMVADGDNQLLVAVKARLRLLGSATLLLESARRGGARLLLLARFGLAACLRIAHLDAAVMVILIVCTEALKSLRASDRIGHVAIHAAHTRRVAAPLRLHQFLQLTARSIGAEEVRALAITIVPLHTLWPALRRHIRGPM